jgi:small subunit ribosomal protein S18
MPTRKVNITLKRKRQCRFCTGKEKGVIDYKNVSLLENFLTERGRIIPRRLSGNCASHQRKLRVAIKRARYLALLPYIRVS